MERGEMSVEGSHDGVGSFGWGWRDGRNDTGGGREGIGFGQIG